MDDVHSEGLNRALGGPATGPASPGAMEDAPPIPRASTLLCLLAWLIFVASAILEGVLCGWSPALLLQQLSRYAWEQSSVDAVLAAFVGALAGSIALCSYPVIGAVFGTAVGVVILVKVVYLAGAAASSNALAAVVTALVSCACAAASCGVALQRIGGGSGRGGDREEKLLGSPDAAPSAPREVTLWRLLGVARPELPMLAVATVALFVSSGAQMAMPALVGNMVGGVLGGGGAAGDDASKIRSLNQAVLDLAIIFIVGGFFSFVRGYLFTLAGERVVARLRRRLFARLVQQDIGFFDSNQTGELMNRLSSDTMVIQNAVTINVSMGLRFGAQVGVQPRGASPPSATRDPHTSPSLCPTLPYVCLPPAFGLLTPPAVLPLHNPPPTFATAEPPTPYSVVR